ncbi:MAG: hypothetical protein ACODAD_11165, partial [Planctomycetota bacterium]
NHKHLGNICNHRLYKLRDPDFLKKELVNARVREGMEIQKMPNGLIRSIRDSDTEHLKPDT